MKLKRTYYTDFKNLWAEIEGSEARRLGALSEAERAAEREQGILEAGAVYEQGLAWRGAHPGVPDPKKEAGFHKMAKDALWLAEVCDMNISVDQNETAGVIQLETDYLLLDELAPKKSRRVFARLLSQADTFSISHMESTYIIEYIFDLCDNEAYF